MERTGHHSIDGVRNYKRTATEQVVEISEILNNSSTKKIKSSTTSGINIGELAVYCKIANIKTRHFYVVGVVPRARAM